MNKRLLMILFIITAMFMLVGCTKLVSTEHKDVEVLVVDEYFRDMFITYTKVGYNTTMHTHPAVYKITVEYDDVEYTIDGASTYNKYKDKVGQVTIGTLEIRNYDNGTVKYDIIALK